MVTITQNGRNHPSNRILNHLLMISTEGQKFPYDQVCELWAGMRKTRALEHSVLDNMLLYTQCCMDMLLCILGMHSV